MVVPKSPLLRTLQTLGSRGHFRLLTDGTPCRFLSSLYLLPESKRGGGGSDDGYGNNEMVPRRGEEWCGEMASNSGATHADVCLS